MAKGKKNKTDKDKTPEGSIIVKTKPKSSTLEDAEAWNKVNNARLLEEQASTAPGTTASAAAS
jgi:hypothetical protein